MNNIPVTICDEDGKVITAWVWYDVTKGDPDTLDVPGTDDMWDIIKVEINDRKIRISELIITYPELYTAICDKLERIVVDGEIDDTDN